MAEIKVTVSSTKPQKVSVSNNTIQHEVTASPDLAQYYSNISKNYSEVAENWATKTDGKVDGIEYSAKHYAQKAETLGIEALQNLEIAETQAIADVNVARDNAIIELNTTGQEQINTVSEKVSEAIEGVENAGRIVEEAIEDIQNTAEKNKKELQTISNEIKENAQDIANRTSLSMFDTILKDHLLTYEESKGLALQGTYVYKEAIAGSRYGYPDFYNKCLEEFNEATSTETVNGVTVKVHSNGHKFYDIANKSAIDSFFNTMGSAWFYGIDTENERIFLPRNNWFEQMTANSLEVGDSIEAGLPNITSETYLYTIAGGDSYGAITMTDTGTSYRVGDGGTTGRTKRLDLDASNSSPVYGKSNTVQPNAVKKLLYICVGNTVSDTSWVDVVTQVEGGVKDLEDKTLEGIERLKQSSTALTQTQITNCILEIPQRIKYTLENGTLTIKAGSVVIVPYGTEDLRESYPVGSTFLNDNFVVVDTQFEDSKFFVWAETQNDIVVVVPASTRTGALVDIAITNSTAFPANSFASGATAPTAGRYYNITNNKYYDMNNTNGTLSLPILSCNFVVNTGFTSVNQVFNGFGYIGSTVWIDKGVKGLIPNGRNADGSLSNIETTTTNISVYTRNLSGDTPLWLNSNGTLFLSAGIAYDEKRNVIYSKSDINNIQKRCQIGITNLTNGVINYFQTKQPFRAVDYNTPHIVETYRNGTSGYLLYSNGWCKQWGVQAGGVGYTHIKTTLLKEYRDTNYLIYGTHINWSSDNNGWYTSTGTIAPQAALDIIGTPSEVGNKSTTGFYLPGHSAHNWITEGFLAEGEY